MRFSQNGLKMKKLNSKSFSEAQNWLTPCKYYVPQTHVFTFTSFTGTFRPQKSKNVILQPFSTRKIRKSENIKKTHNMRLC